MATSKRAPRKPRKKAASGSRAPGKGPARKGAARPSLSGARERLLEVFNREVIGVTLLVCGLFFTAAFATGRGAFLGDAGFEAATHFMGRAGLLLAPLAALAGVLVLLRRLPVRGTLGVALLMIAASGTLAAELSPARRFVADAYEGAGGIVGSGLYAAVQEAGGFVGAVLALALLYALGLSLLTGVTFGAALTGARDAAAGTLARLGDWRENRAAASEDKREAHSRVSPKAPEIGPRSASSRAKSQSSKGEREEGETFSGADSSMPEPSGFGLRVAREPVSRTREAPVVRDLYGELGEDDGAGLTDGGPGGGDVLGDGGRGPEEKTEEFEILVPGPAVPRPVEAPGGTSLLPAARNEAGEEVDYVPPSPSLLDRGHGDPEHDAEGTSRRLTQALSDLGVEAQVLRAVVGPRVTRYELRLGSGVKVGKVRNLQQDIAYALAATEVRILAPIPGKSAVGVEVPNTRPAKVTLGDVFSEYPEVGDMALPVGLGKDIAGRPVFFDMADMPHLLVAGTTGSGKSVMLNGLLTSLLLTTDPRQVKMVLIDPKRVELSQFGRIPHLITPVVTDVKKAANALTWAVAEMERRYEVLERAQVRSLDGYNAKADVPMPYVLVVIDELADLMMQAASKVEDAVIRIAQKARAVGIHLVVATQRPSVDVITGMIKANVPSRIAFAVSSQVDSRVILDTPGAESLLGMGDMLFKPVSAMRPSRVQGAFISEAEVDRVVTATVEASKGRVEAKFVEEVTESRAEREEPEEPEDDLLPGAASFVLATQQASVSAVQRRFRVGYSRAGRIIDALERKGVVGPYEGSKSRAVLGTQADLDSLFGGEDPTDGNPDGNPDGDPDGNPDADPDDAPEDPTGPSDPFGYGGSGIGSGEGR